MNICFLWGKIISEIDFKFIYQDKHYLSVAIFELEISDKNKKMNIPIIAYNEIADFIYSKYSKNDYIKITGTFEANKIIILKIFE